jgi:hypothetical protein
LVPIATAKADISSAKSMSALTPKADIGRRIHAGIGLWLLF